MKMVQKRQRKYKYFGKKKKLNSLNYIKLFRILLI